MKNLVHKLLVKPQPGNYKFQVPTDARFISVAKQGQSIAVWYVTTDRAQLSTPIEITVVMTGQNFDAERRQFLGTVQYESEDEAPFVLHLFSRGA